MNPFDRSLFAAGAPCLPCCGGPTECACALLIPANLDGRTWGTATYADYATAAAAIADRVSNCIGYGETAGFDSLGSFTADDFTTPGTLALSGVGETGSGSAVTMYVSVTVEASSVMMIAFTLDTPNTDGAIIVIYNCADGSTFYSDSGSSSPFTTPAMPAGGYVIEVIATSSDGGIAPSATFTITSDKSYVVNPVIALWDDSGTTRQLEACPKMLLPPLTESSGDWYASCADADAVLSDPLQVASCVAFAENNPLTPFTTFAASGGSSLILTASGFGGGGSNTGQMWGSINAAAGDVITATTSGTVSVLTIYDYTGAIVFPQTIGGASVSSTPLPYTGRYIVALTCAGTPGTPSLMDTVTSSGTMTTNEIQALYDTGLTCPATLSCGDSC